MKHLSRKIKATLASIEEDSPHTDIRVEALSNREIEILQTAANGLTNQEIADRLCISPLTVARHMQNIFSKIGVSNRAEATAFALRNGLIV